MRVAACSIFMNSANYVDRYFDQMHTLGKSFDLSLVLTEGDSNDSTWDELKSRWHPGIYLKQVNHGGPYFGSVDNNQRWEQISRVVRPTIAKALELEPDVVVWVESDLVWDVDVMARLIDSVNVPGRTSCPMVLADSSTRFYDIWGYRMNGKMFLAQEPYLPEDPFHFQQPGSPLVHIDSCGSCFATSDLEALAKWDGRWPYQESSNLKLHTDLVIRHP